MIRMHWRLKAQVGQAFGQLEENIDGTEVCLTSAAKTMKTTFGETWDRYYPKLHYFCLWKWDKNEKEIEKEWNEREKEKKRMEK